MAISIKAARVNANLTQVQMADALGKSKQTIANYESYTTSVPVDVAFEMANLCGLSVNDIRWTAED
jgi:DNA-binding XRE family transcriptional regulator